MTEPRLQRLRVLSSRASRGAERCAQHHGYFPVAAGHVMSFRGLVHHLVHREGQEVAEHDVDHRTETGHGSADSDTSKAGFGNWGIHDALATEFFDESR